VTSNGHIAIAMVNIEDLAIVIDCEPLQKFKQSEAFSKRDEIKTVISDHLANKTTEFWLNKLQEKDLWAMDVLDWKQLSEHDGYKVLGMEQKLVTANGDTIITTSCPIRINGQKIYSSKPAPGLGEHNKKVSNDLLQ
jgi:crotonobetainyl-CoA:carnitine CoA-transferase CaiB-like acyl-CoA transferase